MAEQAYTIITEHSRKAPIWENFNLVQMTSDGSRKARCTRCGDFLKPESNTTLKRHWTSTCKRLKEATDPNQPILDNSGQIWTYDDDLAREMQMKCVIQMGLPFGHFDNANITKMIKKAFQPRYNPVSRQTLRRDAIKLWKKAKKSTKDMFLNLPNKVSLTADVWSAPMGLPQSYLCITAHWIMPDSWQLCKRVIAFHHFGSPHTGERQYSLIMKTLQTYNLKYKIISMSFDNASNNTACIQKLRLVLTPILDGKLFHTRCCAHIINLAVQDGLAQINPILTSFRLMLRRIFTKGKVLQNKYIEYCNSVGFRALGPAHDMPVRWNSTWKMMHNLLRQKEYISAFYNVYYPDNEINDYHWNMLKTFYDILTDFKTATTMLSGVYYPTSPLVLNQIYILANKLAQYENDVNFLNVVKPMKTKLLKYFKDIPFTFLCAAALNPYLNTTAVEIMVKSICLAFGLDSDTNQTFSRNTIVKFNTDFHQLFETYRMNFGGGSQTQTTQTFPPTSSSRSGSRLDLMSSLMHSVTTESSKKARFDGDTLGEFNQYTRTNFIAASATPVDDVEAIDLLEWWKNKQPSFPILSTIALDILTIQASTVASESAFSLSGRIISERRSRLTAESVECCVCLKDFLDGEDRVQHQSDLSDELNGIEVNLAENEDELGLSPPATDTSDAGASDSVSQREDDDNDEGDVTDQLSDATAVERLTRYNTLDEYNPEMNANNYYASYYNPTNYYNNYNPWGYYDPSGAGSSGAGGSGAGGSGSGT